MHTSRAAASWSAPARRLAAAAGRGPAAATPAPAARNGPTLPLPRPLPPWGSSLAMGPRPRAGAAAAAAAASSRISSRSACGLCPPELLWTLQTFLLRSVRTGARWWAAVRGPAATRAAAGGPPGADADPDGPWLLVGLGNPGPKYDKTRHNAGFELIDRLAASEGIRIDSLQHKALVGKGRLWGVPVLLAKPQTFMNASGDSVGALARYYRVPAARLLIAYDDLDLDVAQVRLRAKGGHGGHNGMRSIIPALGSTQEFARLRLGIGRPAGQKPVEVHVLEPFNKQEREAMDFALVEAADGVHVLLTLGLDRALSTQGKWAAALKEPRAARAAPAGAEGGGPAVGVGRRPTAAPPAAGPGSGRA